MMGMLALSIDVMLPALGVLADDLGVENPNHAQHVVSFLILGMAIGQPLYGPLSESIGRKPTILVGLAIFGGGCLVSLAATDLRLMVIGRLLQGIGVAGPRIVTLALVRDQFSGPDMARVMSLVIAVLMVGPLVAPFIGQGVLFFASWRALFVILLGFDVLILLWLTARQPETLPPEGRIPLSWRPIASTFRQVATSRAGLGYACASGVVSGELFAYVNSARQIYQDQYGVGAWFPLLFALSGLAIAAASLASSWAVTRTGPSRLCTRAAVAKLSLAVLFLLGVLVSPGSPPLAAVVAFLVATSFGSGVLFGNLNALAMEPFGHVAGVAAGVVGSVAWLLAMVLSTAVSQQIDGTVVPLAVGFVLLDAALVAVLRRLEG